MKINSEQEMLDFGKSFAESITSMGDVAGRVTDLEGLPRSSQERSSERTPREGKVRQDPPRPIVIELIGDVGAGKTTFVRGFAKGLGVKEPVTSPSFTISKSYALPNNKRLVHYDFYRLSDPGLMSEDLKESLDDKNTITIIEWSDSVSNLLPDDRIIIKIEYTETGGRILSFQHH